MSTSEPKRRGWTAGVIALVVLGLLLVVLSGLCSGAFGLMMVSPSWKAADILKALGLILMVGGPFMVVGVACIVIGLRLRRSH
jgi:hypothetical protein